VLQKNRDMLSLYNINGGKIKDWFTKQVKK